MTALHIGAKEGVDAVWDFSEAVPVGESHRIKYLSFGDSLLVRTENGAMHTYLT